MNDDSLKAISAAIEDAYISLSDAVEKSFQLDKSDQDPNRPLNLVDTTGRMADGLHKVARQLERIADALAHWRRG